MLFAKNYYKKNPAVARKSRPYAGVRRLANDYRVMLNRPLSRIFLEVSDREPKIFGG